MPNLSQPVTPPYPLPRFRALALFNRRPPECMQNPSLPAVENLVWGLSVATVFSGDMIMGGVRNLIETHTSGGALVANITPNNHMVSYLTDEAKLAGVYITEKVDRKTGWQFICLEEEWTRGYLQEIQDFMECVSVRREPRADFALAYETIKVCYAGYWSAEEGQRIVL
jgi:predicted dehydrogenase